MGSVLGLVMTGGGARGAYQAGVLKRIAELYEGKACPFGVVAGASAGAINSAMIAAGMEDFNVCAKHMAFLWGNIKAEHIYRTDLKAISAGAVKLFKDLSLGGALGGGSVQSLLDASPLKKFLSDSIPFDRIQYGIDRGLLKALAVTTTDYTSGKSFIFVQGAAGHPVWKRSRRLTLPVTMTADHIYASAAIPIVFPPCHLSTDFGESYFGDGCLRLVAPLSPAIRLGADRILAIGVRTQTLPDEGFDRLVATNADSGPATADPSEPIEDALKSPPLSRVIGVILNAIFLDHLDADVEHLQRMNEIIESFGQQTTPPPPPGTDGETPHSPMRIVKTLAISPSVDLGHLAIDYAHKLPSVVRYMMKGLGSNLVEGADLMSYLLFDYDYTRALIDIGYRDASLRIREIEEFLNAP